MAAFITSFGTSTPQYRISQRDISKFMIENLGMDEDKQKETEILYRASGINYRYTVLEDYERQVGEFNFFPNSNHLEPFPAVSNRMNVYRKEAVRLSESAAKQAMNGHESQSFTHLITVSCTGMYAPGLDFDLVRQLNLSKSIRRTSINFMGCYAAFNAMKMANDICAANEDTKVLIVCIELCSLHFQKKTDTDTLLANALFGDGAAAMVIESSASQNISLSLENFHCDLMTNGEKDMTWGIGDFGFEMTLSSYVPSLIRQGIRSLTDGLLSSLNLEVNEIEYFAIHPGGKKILEEVENELGIPKEKNQISYDVLRNFGNMSSPTIIFVLKEMFENLEEHDRGAKVLSVAFGPGLTLESALLKVN